MSIDKDQREPTVEISLREHIDRLVEDRFRAKWQLWVQGVLGAFGILITIVAVFAGFWGMDTYKDIQSKMSAIDEVFDSAVEIKKNQRQVDSIASIKSENSRYRGFQVYDCAPSGATWRPGLEQILLDNGFKLPLANQEAETIEYVFSSLLNCESQAAKFISESSSKDSILRFGISIHKVPSNVQSRMSSLIASAYKNVSIKFYEDENLPDSTYAIFCP